jgi:hypothetical protein
MGRCSAQCYEHRAERVLLGRISPMMKRSFKIRELPMPNQLFSPDSYSTRPPDLLDEPDADEDEPISEADRRDGRYRQFAKAIDRDDLKQMVIARILESDAFEVAIENALETPIGLDRVDVHVHDRIRLADAVYAHIRDATDELIEMYAVAEEG